MIFNKVLALLIIVFFFHKKYCFIKIIGASVRRGSCLTNRFRKCGS